jgi:hypothetical protein
VTTLGEVLAASDRRTAFEAVAFGDQPWIKVEVAPSQIDGFWHLALIETEGAVRFFKRPVRAEGVDLFLAHWGVTEADFKAVPREPSRLNPWDLGQPEPTAQDTRDVYFIQGIEGGPIKIGVARDPRDRLVSIQLMSPVRLQILGVIRGAGQPGEHRLHEQFAEHRLHGEWFQPAPELIHYIQENA